MSTDEHRAESLGNLLRRAQQIHARTWLTQVSRDVTSAQSSLLSVVAAEPGIDQTTAIKKAHLERSTGAELVDRMTRNGLVQRERNPADRRYYLLRLTPKGEEVRLAIRPSIVALQDQLSAWVDPELREPMLKGLGQLIRGGEQALDL